MNIQWYPGHMTKARRQMQEDIRLVDLVIELIDARIPFSSRNPDIDQLSQGKYRLILMNKADLADEEQNRKWMTYFQNKGFSVICLDSRTKGEMKRISGEIKKICIQKTLRDQARGIKNRPVRAMVVGIPNVGKSTFINSFAGRAAAKTGDRPGVTKGKQWIRLNKDVELLDTPGILWPKFDDEEVGTRLALIGSVNDEILNREELALQMIAFLLSEYPRALRARYEDIVGPEPLAVYEQIARKRGCLRKGEELDLEKAARLILDDFRQGRFGRITLEEAPEPD
ncbi:MAG: ribosome biogenesis GTPase YlqF [Blautia sp.]|nr:ribosome biogenesis GTPase YlqF [Blautia sp.]